MKINRLSQCLPTMPAVSIFEQVAVRASDELIPTEMFRQRFFDFIFNFVKDIGTADTQFRQAILQNLMTLTSLYENGNRNSTILIEDESVADFLDRSGKHTIDKSNQSIHEYLKDN